MYVTISVIFMDVRYLPHIYLKLTEALYLS